MGRILKSIAIAAVIVGIGVATGGIGFLPGFTAGAAGAVGTVTVGAAITTTAFGSALLAMAVGTVLAGVQAQLFGPKTTKAQASRLNPTLDPSAFRKIVFGETAMNTDVRYFEPSGTDQEYMDYIIATSAHAVESIDEIWFEDRIAWSSATGVDAFYTGYLTVATVLEGTSANYISINGGAKWGSTRRLTGCSYVHLRIKRTGTASKVDSPLVNGLPGRVTIRGKGAKIYDPRLDSTVTGGSGSQRANDQTTWGASQSGYRDNPALQLLWFLLGWKIGGKLSVGCGVPPSRIDLASFIIAANICDEAITLAAGGTQPRYRTGGVASDSDQRMEIIQIFLSAMNGTLRDSSGKLAVVSMKNDLASPVLEFSDDDIFGDFTWNQTRGLDESFNAIHGKYTDPSNNSLYQAIEYPVQSITSIDGIERMQTLDLPFVQEGRRAQRIAKQVLQRAQYKGVFSATFNMKALGCRVGNCVWISFQPLGWVDKPFRVLSQSINNTGQVPMTLIEENAAIYAWDANESAVITPTSPTSYDPLNSPYILAAIEAASTANWSGIIDDNGGLPDDNATVGAPSGTYVAGVLATQVAQVATDFSTQNNRVSTAITAPTVATDGTAVDHTIETDGSANMSFEWSWSGDEGTIDGFLVYLYKSNTNGTYTIGSSPAEELVYPIPASKRSFFWYGISPDKYYTVGVRAYRAVDNDINTNGIIMSTVRQPSLSNENPYQPATSVQFAGNITGSVGNVAATTIAQVATDFSIQNNRVSTAISAPTIATDGTAVDHTIETDGSANMSFEWSWSGDEGTIDGFLIYLYKSNTNSPYTIGSTPAEELVYSIPASKRSFFWYGIAPDKYYTVGVKAYRAVDNDINTNGIITSSIRQPTLTSENPYQPATSVQFAGNITGSVGNVAASTIAQVATDFNNQNNRDSSPVAAPTINTDGTAVDHTVENDGSANISFEWNWSGDEGTIDGFLVYMYKANTNGSYIIGSSPSSETVQILTADKRVAYYYGVSADRYYTFGVRAFRKVDNDINTNGIILSTLRQPTLANENPYQPSTSVAFAGNITGTVDGLQATAVSGAINTDGTIKTNKVDTLSVQSNAISTSAFAQTGGALGTIGGAVTVQTLGMTTTGGPVVVQFAMAGYAQSNAAGVFGYQVTLYRNGTLLRNTIIQQAVATASGQRLPFVFSCPIMDTPAAGVQEYSFNVDISGGATAGVNISAVRSIDARELKR